MDLASITRFEVMYNSISGYNHSINVYDWTMCIRLISRLEIFIDLKYMLTLSFS